MLISIRFLLNRMFIPNLTSSFPLLDEVSQGLSQKISGPMYPLMIAVDRAQRQSRLWTEKFEELFSSAKYTKATLWHKKRVIIHYRVVHRILPVILFFVYYGLLLEIQLKFWIGTLHIKEFWSKCFRLLYPANLLTPY